MADAGAGCAQARDFVRVEVNAVGQPGARAEPADAVEVIHGTQPEALQAEIFLIEGFRQMGVQAHVQLVGQLGAGLHDFGGDGKRRARRQGDLDLRTVTALVIFADQALAVFENHLALLHRLLRRQAAIGFAQAHGTAGEHGAHPQFTHAAYLHINGVFQTIGEQVVVIGRRGAAREQQFGQGDFAGQGEFFRGEPRPYRVQGFQPGKQRLVDHRAPGTGQGLIEVVVGVDQPRQHHMLAGIEHLGARLCRRLPLGQHFGDDTVLQHQAATGIEAIGSENREGVF